jgi:hypothetical protein
VFTWKRISIIISLGAIGILALRLADVPKVAAQVKAALVRSVDEPARVPYFVSGPPTCPFGNECEIVGPVVPAGKRVRVTRLEGFFINTSVNGFAALELNDDNHPVVMFPVVLFAGAFFGQVFAFNQDVDFNFEAGQTPLLVVGVPGLSSIGVDARNRLSMAGYIVDLTP